MHVGTLRAVCPQNNNVSTTGGGVFIDQPADKIVTLSNSSFLKNSAGVGARLRVRPLSAWLVQVGAG